MSNWVLSWGQIPGAARLRPLLYWWCHSESPVSIGRWLKCSSLKVTLAFPLEDVPEELKGRNSCSIPSTCCAPYPPPAATFGSITVFPTLVIAAHDCPFIKQPGV